MQFLLKFKRHLGFGLLLVASLWFSSASAIPRVVVSIPPFYGLVASLMQTVGTPHLLLPANASPHHYFLRPNDIQYLQEAQIIVWAGPNLESFLTKSLKQLPASIKIIQLDETPHLIKLPIRDNSHFEAHHCSDEEHTHSDAGKNFDPHVWLDPENAIFIVQELSRQFTATYPQYQLQFEKNAEKLINALKKLDFDLKQALAPLHNKFFFVFHDAYQYFEQRYQLHNVGSITIHPEIPLSAKRMNQIKKSLEQKKVVCVFTEPQFPTKLLDTVLQGTEVHRGELNPLGPTTITEDNYFVLMHNLKTAFLGCLK